MGRRRLQLGARRVRRRRRAFARMVAVAGLCLCGTPAVARAQSPEPGPTGCADASIQASGENVQRIGRALVCVLNEHRSRSGLAPLTQDARLDRASAGKAEDMVRHRYFAHERSGRPSLFARIMATGYFARVAGGLYTENLGVAPLPRATALNLVTAWMKSDYHRANVLHPSFRDIGIGIAFAGRDPVFYADYPSAVFATDFGRRYYRRPRERCVRGTAPSGDPAAAPLRRYCTKPRRRRARR